MKFVATAVAALLVGSSTVFAADDPCTALINAVELADGQSAFIASFPTAGPGPLEKVAFLYDNAAAAIALIGCGQTEKARLIGDAMLEAQMRDRHWHDGRLRNGYLAGQVGNPAKLAGWWDAKAGHWVEDGYQAGSDTGNMAWAMLALLTLFEQTGETRYRDGAVEIAEFVDRSFADDGVPGFEGGQFGFEPEPTQNHWKSTEHNTDLAAALARLAKVTDEAHWDRRAQEAEGFVRAMWREECSCLAVGTGVDGKTPNPLLALDAQIWPLLAIAGGDGSFPGMLSTVESRLAHGSGYAYGEAKQGMWIEGTAQAGLLFELRGNDLKAEALRAVVSQHRTPEGWYYAADTTELPTGFVLETDPSKPRVYFRLPHLGALAWVALFEQRFNPFTGRQTLPSPSELPAATP